MTILSIVLNIITIAIVVSALFFQGHNLEGDIRKYKPFDRLFATKVFNDNEYDPLVTGRAYFAEEKTGNLGKFTGNTITAREENWDDDVGHIQKVN
ncbi:MAG: hypothetical protein CMB57_06300 [Euryarchaeota archaeon]|nr:hypothetical protein [Euryarchaeota archaeon]|tara:strand:- start:7119 stop:7406 length:288 start_codon:yes stop_codon:yes gene_type:complete